MIILDSSAAIEMVLESEEGIGMQEMMLDNEEVISCSLFGAETASVMRKMKRNGKVSDKEAYAYYDKAQDLVDRFYPIEELQNEALHESIRLDHSVYDMFYFVLARRTGGTLFSTDNKLLDLCAANGVDGIEFIENLCGD